MVQVQWAKVIAAMALLMSVCVSQVRADDFDATVTGAHATAVKTTTDGVTTVNIVRTNVSGRTVISVPGDGSVTVADLVLSDSAGNVVGTCTFSPGTINAKIKFLVVEGTVTIGAGETAVTAKVQLTGLIVTSRRTGKTTLAGSLFAYNRDPLHAIAARVAGTPVVPPPAE